jgi:hypothetical protein
VVFDTDRGPFRFQPQRCSALTMATIPIYIGNVYR